MYKTILNSLKTRKDKTYLTLVLRLLGIVFIFSVTYFLTNLYNPEVVGLYDFTRSYFLIVGSLCMLSMDQAVIYLIGKKGSDFNSLKSLYLKISVICFSLYLLNLFVFKCVDYLNLIELGATTKSIIIKSNFVVFFYGIVLINTEIFRVYNKVVLSEFFRNVIKYIPLFVGFIFIKDDKDALLVIDFFIYGFVVISAISTVLLFYLDKKRRIFINKNSAEDNNSITEIIRYSIPITISTVSLYLLSSIDVFLLKFFLGDKYVAYYSVAFKVVSIINVSINAITLSAASKIAHNFINKNFERLQEIVKRTALINFFFSFLFTVFIFVIKDQVLLLFGQEYLLSKDTLLILVFGNLIMSIAGNSYIYLLMTNKGVILGRLLLIAVVINFILNYILIPKIGIKGAAIASVFSIIFWNFYAAYISYKKDGINILFPLLKKSKSENK